MRRWLLRAGSLLVAVAIGAGLWIWSGGDQGQGRGLTGGPLFPFTPDDVVSLEIIRTGGVQRLERTTDGGWRLTGLVDDLVDPARLDPVLAAIVGGEGQPVLAGTEPDERRFGFGDEDALELVFHLRGGGRDRLAVGSANPASGMIYASGAGRTGVFGIGGGIYAKAVRLPDSVRWADLLPEMRLADLDSLHLGRRGGEPLRFTRTADGRWWLHGPGGLDALAGRAARYHGLYRDRAEQRDGAWWFLADRDRLGLLVFRAWDTNVVQFPVPGSVSAELQAELGLAPPYRQLTFFGPGDLSHRLALGEEQDDRTVLARRETALLVTRSEALHPAEGPVSDFLALGPFSFRLADADSFRLDQPDRPLLWARRAPDVAQRKRDLESIWDPAVPAGWQATFGLEVLGDHLSDMQFNLDRLATLAVRDPQPADPLARADRWRLRAWYGVEPECEVWLGRLTASGEAAVWDPADGKVLVVPEEILVSLRNLRHDLRR